MVFAFIFFIIAILVILGIGSSYYSPYQDYHINTPSIPSPGPGPFDFPPGPGGDGAGFGGGGGFGGGNDQPSFTPDQDLRSFDSEFGG
ncbi:MAG: hypothetical protein M3162_05775 [Thermoproteota archaeon]|nr:hypothetical protein [Thermoproteota archaeon]